MWIVGLNLADKNRLRKNDLRRQMTACFFLKDPYGSGLTCKTIGTGKRADVSRAGKEIIEAEGEPDVTRKREMEMRLEGLRPFQPYNVATVEVRTLFSTYFILLLCCAE